MKEKFLGGWGGGTVAGEEPRPSSGRTAGPPPLAAHLPGPLSAALAAQPRRLPGEQALLTDSVLLLFLFYSHPGQSLETRSGTFIRMSCCLPKTSVSEPRLRVDGTPTFAVASLSEWHSVRKLPEPPEATGGKE